MVFKSRKEKQAIRCCIALLCVAALVMTAAAATARTVPVNGQPVTVNASPVPTPVAPERIVIVTPTATPAPVRIITPVTTVTVSAVRTLIPVTTVTTTETLLTGGAGRVNGVSPAVTRVPAGLVQQGIRETTAGTKNPLTGDELSKGTNPGSGLPGGAASLPSAEEQWNSRPGSTWTGEIGSTPFDTNPLSDPVDDFLNQHGGNLDPLAAKGTGGPGISPADSGDSSGDVTVITNEDGSSSMLLSGGSAGVDDGNREFVLIEFDSGGNYKTEGDRQLAEDWFASRGNEQTDQGTTNSAGVTSNQVQTSGSDPLAIFRGYHDQQYEGEGGYTGGGGGSANDITPGSAGRFRGTGGNSEGEAGLGRDTGGNIPAVYEAIAKYIAKGGKLHGVKGGYDTGSSGLGGDIGGASENRVSGLKKSLNAERFVIDPDTMIGDEIPWWLEKVVSPKAQAATTTT